ncbi:MAG: hypothetical protein KGJ66_14315 [Alphaproteobacteria bacterium]|nr:hypothetical protein [Alphaproteobacteria bacterium]
MIAVQAKCAYYERCGPAREVLALGEMAVQPPAAAEVFVRLRFSSVNPTNIKNRSGVLGRGMAFDRIVPHHDGAGIVEATGDGVPATPGRKTGLGVLRPAQEAVRDGKRIH